MKKHLWLLLIVFLPLQSFAQSINARFSTSFYSLERHLADSSTTDYLRVYQTARVTIGQISSRNLSFHFYGQIAQDLSEDADDDPIPRIYNAYIQWKNKNRQGVLQDFKLGRQRVYSGVAYGSVDGVDLTFHVKNVLKVGGFAGFLVPISNEIEIDDWKDSHAFGIRVSTDRVLGSKILFSFMQRNRRPVPYSDPGRYTQRVLSFESRSQRLIGIDVYRDLSQHINAYGRFDYDLEQKQVRRGQFELRLQPSQKLELTGEFFHRAPLIEANSIFTVFEQNTTQDLGFRVNYRIRDSWSVYGNAGFLFYDRDETQRFSIGAHCKYGSLGYNFRNGYGGRNSGITASLNYPLTSKLNLLASTGYSRYSLFDADAIKNTSFTSSFGFNYRVHKQFSVDFLGQGIRNKFYDNDFRFFAKANYWFFKSKTSGGNS